MIIQDFAFRPFFGCNNLASSRNYSQLMISLVTPSSLPYFSGTLDQFLKKDNFYCKYNNGHSKGLNNSIFICKHEFIYKDVLVTK